ncbi:hypothetical protein [Enterobacter kobei]|uniref:hypothetical protein n=1 Tax=Enterobacter kobei TaxID=208224 RepID=UPI003CF17F32
MDTVCVVSKNHLITGAVVYFLEKIHNLKTRHFYSIEDLVSTLKSEPSFKFRKIIINYDYYYHDRLIESIVFINKKIRNTKDIFFLTSKMFHPAINALGFDTIDVDAPISMITMKLRFALRPSLSDSEKIRKNQLTYMEKLVIKDFFKEGNKLTIPDKIKSVHKGHALKKMGIHNTAMYFQVFRYGISNVLSYAFHHNILC